MKEYHLYSMSEANILKLSIELQKILLRQISIFDIISEKFFFNAKNIAIPDTDGINLEKWIKQTTHKELLNNHIFLALKHTNVVYRNTIKSILKKMASSDAVITHSEYKMLATTHELMISNIMDILTSLLETKFQFDTLTGAINRRAFEQILNSEQAEVDRQSKKSFLAFADIDHFKTVNDTYGHDAGDEVLKSVVDILQAETRNHDTVSRWGGEEFLILLPGTSKEDSEMVMNRIREKIESHDFSIPSGETLKLTCSFGYSNFNKSSPIESLTKSADEALYEAKTSGRNKVVFKRLK